MRFDVGGIDHLRICGSSPTSKRSEQVFPNPTPRPAHEAVIDRCRRTIFGRAIAPAAATFQHVYDAADDTAIVGPLDTPYIRRQVGFDPLPLLIAQPKQALAHDPNPLPKSNQDRIVRPEKLMSSDPRFCSAANAAMCHSRPNALEHERHKKKDRQPRRSLQNSIGCFDQAAIAAAFRFLRQPSKPNAPRPEAKSGSAAGRGVADAGALPIPSLM